MDPYPLIPENFTHHEVAPSLRSALQTVLDGQVYEKNIAENYLQNIDNEDEKYLRNNAKAALDIHNKAEEDVSKSQLASVDIMLQQAKYLIDKSKIDNSSELREAIKLKRCELFKKLETEFVVEYNLIQSSDLLPDLIHQYLEYREKNHEICPACKEKIKRKPAKQKMNKVIERGLQEETVTLGRKNVDSFRVIPNNINFHNYEVDKVYHRIIKIINTSSTLQAISLKSWPKASYFSVTLNNNTQKIASGMSVVATITFAPRIYKTIKDSIRFRNNSGECVEVQLTVSRDVPKLISCIFKSNTNLLEYNEPGCTFKEKRREALNSTIDCGSCLVSQYVLISIILENKGMLGKFFFITEDDWFFQNIDDVSSCMELFKGNFWIYPTFFEIDKGEIVEISLIFQPTKSGLHVETLYLMCDNNSFQQIELVGDAIEFSQKLIEINIPPEEQQVTNKESYIVFFGHTHARTTKTLVVNVSNKSAINLTFEWKFRKNDLTNVENISESWITQKNFCAKITPYSKTNFEFDIYLDSKKSGYHSIFFCFYITNIPLISLEENENFIIVERKDVTGKTLSEPVDVLISEIEVCTFIDKEQEQETCPCADNIPTTREQKMKFSCPFISFGIIPSGLNVQKEFYVRNNSSEEVSWKIMEIKYNLDTQPYMDIMKDSSNLNENSGICSELHFKKLFYKIMDKNPVSYVAMLVLLSISAENTTEIEDICVVTYEVINFDIEIKTKHTAFPILCPLELVYRGIPTQIQFSVENHSPIIGYFQFLNPIGEDIDKIVVELTPSSSIIKPHESITITAKLICTEIGLFENFYIPCFVGLGQEPITVKVLCVVEGAHLNFYLPLENDRFKKVIWPPMISYNYEIDFCPCEEKECIFNEEEPFPSPRLSVIPQSALLNNIVKLNFPTDDSNKIKFTCECKDSVKSLVPDTEPSTSSTEPGAINTRLENMLREEFDDNIFLHEDIIEVYNVPVFTPKKVSIYLENITPIPVRYNVEPKNFVDNKNFDHVAVRLRLKKNEEIWNDLMGTEYGIVVQPEIDQEQIEGFVALRVDIWIYANTFGVYTEEIIVELFEIPIFYFSMLIEVVGSPVQIPMGLNCVTEMPVIRFGSVPFDSPDVIRQIKILNVSSVPIQIIWQPFINKPNDDFYSNINFNFLFEVGNVSLNKELGKAVLLDKWFGKASGVFCDIDFRETYLDPHSSTYLNVIIKPQHFLSQTETILDVTNFLVGFIHLKPNDMKKVNYYFRKSGPNLNIEINIETRLERPTMVLDLLGEKCISIEIYANEVLFKRKCEFSEYVVLRNTSSLSFKAEVSIDYPFYFKISKNELAQLTTVFLNACGAVELTIYCNFDPCEILCLSNTLYQYDKNDAHDCKCNKKLLGSKDTYRVDTEKKSIHFNKQFTICRGRNVEQFPLQLDIYFPNISVKPTTLEFSNVLLNQTIKDVITIFNHTGYEVKFEISKSNDANSFVVTPHYGKIPASTGTLKQFVNVFVYFCATECKKYTESLRIVTNISDYYIEVPLKGVGTINEKFVNNYKI